MLRLEAGVDDRNADRWITESDSKNPGPDSGSDSGSAPGSGPSNQDHHPLHPPGEHPGSGGDRGEPDLRALVRDAAAGDEAAWSSLVGLYTRRVYALARSRLGSPELAEEITQDVFVKVAQSFGRDRTERGGYTDLDRFEPWLFRIAMNRIRDEGRARSRRRTLHERLRGERGPSGPGPEAAPRHIGPAGDLVDLAALRRALRRLSGADREVIELRHHAQLSFQCIADQLGEPMGTVLARHHRALKKLRTQLERESGTPETVNHPAAGPDHRRTTSRDQS